MAKYKLELLTEARLQLRDIAAYHLRKVGSQSAEKITNLILDEVDKLADFPFLGVTPPSEMVAKAGYRMLIIGDYLCFYSLYENTVYVSHIVHGITDYMKKLF
jgi:plasmid stabilization system protein ParE